MANSGGSISAPVSIYDLQQAFGIASGDLMTLYRTDKINPWSKHKPIRHWDFDVLRPTLESNTYRGEQLDECSKLYCGMSVVVMDESTMKQKGGNRGIKGFVEQFFGTPTNFTKTYEPFTYIIPNTWARLADFDGYTSIAKTTFNLIPNSSTAPEYVDVPDGTPTAFTFKLYHHEAAEYNVMPEDILGAIGSYSDWKLRVEVYDSLRETQEGNGYFYYDSALLSTSQNWVYAECDIPITLPAGFTATMPIVFTPYLYNTQNELAVILPQSKSINIEYRKRPRVINVTSIYNGTKWASPNSMITLDVNAIRAELSIEKLLNTFAIGDTSEYQGMIRISATYGGVTNFIIGYAVERDGTHTQNHGWVIQPYGGFGDEKYQTVWFQFDNILQGQPIKQGAVANISIELSADYGSSWSMYAGFSVGIGFNY